MSRSLDSERTFLETIQLDALLTVIDNGDPKGIATFEIFKALAKGISRQKIGEAVRNGTEWGENIILDLRVLDQSHKPTLTSR